MNSIAQLFGMSYISAGYILENAINIIFMVNQRLKFFGGSHKARKHKIYIYQGI